MANIIQLQLDDSVIERIVERVLNKTKMLTFSEHGGDDKVKISQTEAADFLGISQATLIEWKKQGKIPFEQIPGTRKITFYKEDLKNVLKQNNHLIKMPKN